MIPGLGRSPGEGNSNPLQCSCLGNPLDRGAWQATVHAVAKSRTRQSTHMHTHTHTHKSQAMAYTEWESAPILWVQTKRRELSVENFKTIRHTKSPSAVYSHHMPTLLNSISDNGLSSNSCNSCRDLITCMRALR